jgi:tRNA-dihydrouridine synthase B
MQIGPHTISPNLILAPMAGVTDKPFRMLCKNMGAGLCVSEMTISNPKFWQTSKSVHRMDHLGEPAPISVQIAGTDPNQLADAARFNVEHGAQIIDINMGCPAKKVCNVLAGSALMRDEKLVAEILSAVVNSVDVPVTLKIRTGWSPDERNALAIARIAQDCGIQSLAVHGRTRQDFYTGLAEYDTIAAVKQAVRIPVVANGDVSDPVKAKFVLDYTGADALMIGRAAQGRPWIFRHIRHYLETGELLPEPPVSFIAETLLGHLKQLHEFYGELQGVRIARKHLGWYSAAQENAVEFRARVNKAETACEQIAITEDYFAGLAAK